MRKQLLVDGNSIVYRSGMSYLPGIGRTTLELVSAMQRIDDLPFDVAIFTQTIRGNLAVKSAPFKHINLPLPVGKPSELMLKKIPILDMIAPHDLLHIPHNYAVVFNPSKTIVTIHDAMYFSYPEKFLGHEHARKLYPPFIKACRSIVTCSYSSKRDIVEYMGISPDKISVVPWGVNTNVFYPTSKDDVLKSLEKTMGIKRPYFVCVSCDIGRKNTISAMRAFRNALRQNIEHDLILVWGNPPEKYIREFSTEIKSNRIRFVSHVDDHALRLLYCGSTLSLFPSKYEGFGLPVLESMACGTPVMTCNNSSLVEVGGDVALYVEPDDILTMSDLMIGFDKGWQGYDEMVHKSLKHASSFTWECTADKYVEIFAENM